MESALVRRFNNFSDRLTVTEPGRQLQLALLFAITWLIAHPYLRLRHDGVLYFGQLLHNLDPARLANDPFFRYGSQDNFSLFSTVATWATQVFGVFAAAPLLLLLTQTATAVAVVVLAFRLLGRTYAWFGALAVAAMPAWYGGWHIFSYAENFLTARSFAEPIILLAMAALVADRRWWSLALLAVGAFSHPLMALPALVVWWLANALRDRRFYWFVALALIPVGLGLAGHAPFDKLFAAYDSAWAERVVEVNGFVLPSVWPLVDWCYIAVDFIILLTIRRQSDSPRIRRLLEALMITAAGSILLTEIGFTLLQNVLLTGLQTWRSLWLLHLIAMLFLPVLIIEALKRNDDCGRLLAPAWLMTMFASVSYAGPFAAGFASLVARRGTAPCPQLSTPLVHKALWFGVVLLVLTIIGRWTPPPEFAEHVLGETGYDYWRFIRTSAAQAPIPLLAGLLLLPLALQPVRRKWPLLGLALIGLALAASVDQRTQWYQYIEQEKPADHPFLQHIAPGQEVYWDVELIVPWFVLGRPSYYHEDQTAGTIFNRESAMALSHRRKLLRYIEFQLSICGIQDTLEWKSQTQNRADCYPTDDVLHELCNSDDPPAFFVLRKELPAPMPLSSWNTSVPQGHDYRTYHLYSCQQIRDTMSAVTQ